MVHDNRLLNVTSSVAETNIEEQSNRRFFDLFLNFLIVQFFLSDITSAEVLGDRPVNVDAGTSGISNAKKRGRDEAGVESEIANEGGCPKKLKTDKGTIKIKSKFYDFVE